MVFHTETGTEKDTLDLDLKLVLSLSVVLSRVELAGTWEWRLKDKSRVKGTSWGSIKLFSAEDEK